LGLHEKGGKIVQRFLPYTSVTVTICTRT